MSEFKLKYEDLPEKSTSLVEPGVHKFTIVEAKTLSALTTGSTMIQCTYQIDDTNFKINFDNFPLFKSNGDPINFGQNKLKKVLDAINVKPKGELSPTLICKLIVNKSFSAELIYDKEQKYLVLGSLNSIRPYLENENEAAELFLEKETKQKTPNPQTNTETEEAEDVEVEDISIEDFM
jgi:hypothetical protein